MAVSLGEIVATLKLRDELTPALKLAGNQLQTTGKRLTSFGTTMQSVGTSMLPLSAGIAAVGGTSAKVFADFESGMNRVRAVTGAVTKGVGTDYERLESQAKELGATTVFTARQSADAMGFLGLAGFSVNEILGAMPKTLQLAAAAQLDVADAADITAKVMRGYGMEVEDLQRVNDVMVKAFTRSNTNLQQLGDAFRMAGPVANVAGLQFEETTAALSLMADAGFQATLGGTALRGAIARLSGAVPAVTRELKSMGIQTVDSAGQMLPLANILEQLEQRGLTTGEIMRLFGQRAGPAMAALLERGSGALREFTETLDRSGKQLDVVGGIAKQIQDVQLEGLKGKFILLKSAVEGLQIAIGEALAPVLGRMADRLTEVARYLQNVVIPAFRQLPESVQTGVISIAMALAALPAVLIPLGAAVKLAGFAFQGFGTAILASSGWVKDSIKWLGKHVTAVGGANKSLKGFGYAATNVGQGLFKLDTVLGLVRTGLTYVTTALSGAGIVIGVVAAAFAGLMVWLYKFTSYGEQMDSIWSRISGLVKEVAGLIKDALGVAVQLAIGWFRGLGLMIADVIGWFGRVSKEWGMFLDAAKQYIPVLRNLEMGFGLVEVGVILLTARVKALREELQLIESIPLLGRLFAMGGSGGAQTGMGTGVNAPMLRVRQGVPEDVLRSAKPISVAAQWAGTFFKDMVDEQEAVAATARAEAVKKAVESIRDSQNEAVISAQAWARVVSGREITQLPDATKTGMLNALEDVTAQFGSLKAAGVGSLEAIYQALLLATGQANQLIPALQLLNTTQVPTGALGTSIFEASTRKAGETIGAFAARSKEAIAGIIGPDSVPSLSDLFKQFDLTGGAAGVKMGKGIPVEALGIKIDTKLFSGSITKALADGFKGFGSQLGPTIMSALTGGGDVGKAVGGLLGGSIATNTTSFISGGVSKMLGPKLGAAIGSIIPGLGTLAGSLIGGGISKIVGKFFGSKGRDMVKEFANQFGGFDALREKLNTLGAEGERLWMRLTQGVGKNDAKGAQAAIDAVTKALQRNEEEARKAAERAAALQEKFGGLTAALEEFGGVVPQALRPMVEELLKSTELTEEQRRLLEELAGDPSWRTLQSTAEKYGIELEALGSKFQQARISELAMEYARDFNMLVEAGADVNGVLEGMKDEVQDVITNATRFGLEIPAALRPVIEKLIEMGQLTDYNGETLKSLDGLKFSGTLEDGLKGIQTVLEDIRDFLMYGLQGPAEQARRTLEERLGAPLKIKVEYDSDGLPTKGNVGFTVDEDGLPSLAGGTGNRFARFDPGGQLAVLHGDEAVTPRSGVGSLAQEIAALLGPNIGTEAIDRIDNRLASLPSVLARAVRDAVQTA